MSKIKLTKGELKRQRDALKQFAHFLPTLKLKKQQLQTKIMEIKRELARLEEQLKKQKHSIEKWVGLLSDPALERTMDIQEWVVPASQDVDIDLLNIAGANIPVLKDVRFKQEAYDLYLTPYWTDKGIEALQEHMRGMIEAGIVREQIKILYKALRVTTQRVNLFEKVKIPECQENIRVIRIYLGDQQANAVGISKVAKKKIELVASY